MPQARWQFPNFSGTGQRARACLTAPAVFDDLARACWLSGVNRFYDFHHSHLPCSPGVSALPSFVPDLPAADLDLEIPHSDLALLPITPMH
jgi:hypothetical protein